MVSEGLIEKVKSELREKVMQTWRKNMPGSKNSNCKGPEAGTCKTVLVFLFCFVLRSSKEVSVARVKGVQSRMTEG